MKHTTIIIRQDMTMSVNLADDGPARDFGEKFLRKLNTILRLMSDPNEPVMWAEEITDQVNENPNMN